MVGAADAEDTADLVGEGSAALGAKAAQTKSGRADARPTRGTAHPVNPRPATVLLQSWQNGDIDAFDRLVELLYDELRQLAGRAMRGQPSEHTLQPTALVHEAYVRLAGADTGFADRSHFLAAAATVMRRILIDHARRASRAKRGGKAVRVTLDDSRIGPSAPDPGFADIIALDQALTRLSGESPRRGKAVELHYFGGLNLEEMAAVLEVSVGTAHRDLKLARAWLHRELQA